MLHLTVNDIAAFTVLLVGLTGQNRATILHAPAAHHRADGYAGGPATAVIELDKPRRGRHRHMDVALVDLPDWVPTPTRKNDAASHSGGRDRLPACVGRHPRPVTAATSHTRQSQIAQRATKRTLLFCQVPRQCNHAGPRSRG